MADVSFAMLVARSAGGRARAALARALERLPATLHEVDLDARLETLRECAWSTGTEWIICVDPDAIVAPDAFGGLRRALGERPALLGGRGLIDGQPHFGAMFAPVRSGPNPFELAAITGFEQGSNVNELVRGPIDVPQRGVVVVDAAFMRALPPDAELDALLLHVDLAVWARRAGRAVRCEPGMSFDVERDDVAVQERLLDLRRFAALDPWDPATLWRQPPGLRSYLIDRDTRSDGNFRGFLKRPLPPLQTVTYRPQDVDLVRRALARTGDRYVLLVPAGTIVPRTTIETLIARVERSARHVLAVEHEHAPYGAVLVHAGRLPAGGDLRGDDVVALIGDAIATLPALRLYAVGPQAPLVPAELPAIPAIASFDVVFVAAAQPIVANQTLQAILRENLGGDLTAVYPAGAETLRRALGSYPQVQALPDAVDPILARGLNRAIARSRADAIAIVRDDALATSGIFGRLAAAFARIPRLGAVVPRIGGVERPEGIAETGYNSAAEMQVYADRRAASYEREVTLVPFATAPFLMVSRRAFELVGGFDERFGFSRHGVEDLTRRIAAANLLVAFAEDAWAHLFPGEIVESLLVPIDLAPAVADAARDRWSGRDDFDAARDRVPFPAIDEEIVAAGDREPVRLLFVVTSAEAWARVAPYFAAVVDAFRSDDPVEIAIALGEGMGLAAFAAGLREALVASGVPLERTVNVHVEPVADLPAWVSAHGRAMRFAAVDHPALADLPAVADVAALRALVAVEAVG